MRKTLTIFAMIAILASSTLYSKQDIYKWNDLIFKDDFATEKKSGKPADGKLKSYYESGHLNSEYVLKNGKENGIIKSYYESGQLKLEGAFINGKRDGITKSYYESGQPEAVIVYIQGRATDGYFYNQDGTNREFSKADLLLMSE